MTHISEWGLGVCAGIGVGVVGTIEEMRAHGLRSDTVACSGEGAPTVGYENLAIMELAVERLPTCPRCAVLRDAALEGRLPRKKE